MTDQSPSAQNATFLDGANADYIDPRVKRLKPMRLATLAIAALALSACVQDEMETGVIPLGPETESWGMLDSAILSVDSDGNDNGTETTVLQIDSAAVSDDELAAAPELICEDGTPNVLSSDVRSPTAAEGLGDNVLIMTVTCGP